MSEPTAPDPVMPAPAVAPQAPGLGPPPRPPRWPAAFTLLLPLAMVVALLLLVTAGVGAGLRWLLYTEVGTRWVLNAIPGVQVEGLRGALLAETLGAERVRVTWGGGHAWVQVDGVELEGVRWGLSSEADIWLTLDVAQARARRVEVETGPPGPRPLPWAAGSWPPP